jgi:hypothetical protein
LTQATEELILALFESTESATGNVVSLQPVEELSRSEWLFNFD